MNSKKITDKWYKYLFNNYPFIQWKVELEEDTYKVYNDNACLSITARCLTSRKGVMIRQIPVYATDKYIKSEIKIIVKGLKKLSREYLRQIIT